MSTTINETTPQQAAVPVTLTPEAMEKIKYFAEKQTDEAKKVFRVYVEAGGCSGLQYGFVFDQVRDGDAVIEADGVKVVVDPTSIMYMQGSTIHYVEDFTGAGFSVKNPQATGSCGCGHSFFT
ncbi:MAG TPA: iron-sulfur cluster insertion protein ErpA [bacterium]|nr:iron-sulfur cluster insertion protein ErpA [bacterium]